MDEITPLAPASVDRAVTTLERAFANDPMFQWIFPDERARSLRVLNRVPLVYGLRYGHVTRAGAGRPGPAPPLSRRAARARVAFVLLTVPRRPPGGIRVSAGGRPPGGWRPAAPRRPPPSSGS